MLRGIRVYYPEFGPPWPVQWDWIRWEFIRWEFIRWEFIRWESDQPTNHRDP